MKHVILIIGLIGLIVSVITRDPNITREIVMFACGEK